MFLHVANYMLQKDKGVVFMKAFQLQAGDEAKIVDLK